MLCGIDIIMQNIILPVKSFLLAHVQGHYWTFGLTSKYLIVLISKAKIMGWMF